MLVSQQALKRYNCNLDFYVTLYCLRFAALPRREFDCEGVEELCVTKDINLQVIQLLSALF
jgi:hypothetical protein